MDKPTGPRLEIRLADLEEQVAALTARLGPRPDPPVDGDISWVLDGLRHRAGANDAGSVLYAGRVDLPGGEHVDCRHGAAVDDLLGADWAEQAVALAALGHPVRLMLLHRVLSGVGTAAELAAGEGVGTTGQLYHHLRQLVSAGWLRSSTRGRYAVPAERVVPLLVIMSGVRR